jgi:Mg/Co/Ni transporter MgtE
LAGVGDEEITDGVITKTKRRFNWLLLNLFTAFLATWCISLFGATIEQMVVLAFLMPIVASMGGNAGMQTLAVTVRTIATNDLTENNFTTNVIKEFSIGILNFCCYKCFYCPNMVPGQYSFNNNFNFYGFNHDYCWPIWNISASYFKKDEY